MSEIYIKMKNAIDFVFPFIENYKANGTLRQKILNKNPHSIFDEIKNSNAISIDILKNQYADTIYVKDKLEDKAKTNLAGITIAITLIMGASGILTAINGKYPTGVFL